MPFLITFLAGISTVLGALLIFKKNTMTTKTLSNCLFFASGVMISVSLINLIPEAFLFLTDQYTSIFIFLQLLVCINIGVVISILTDKLLPHHHDKIYRIGIISMITIMIHNLLEGIATYLTSSANILLGITLALTIAAHNIPEGIVIAIPIYQASKSKTKAIFYTFISGISELLGAVFAYFFLEPIISNHFIGYLYAIIAGIMLYTSFYELIPAAKYYNRQKTSYIYILIGIFIILINQFLFHQ